mgnify:CR=1 FL=1
MTNTATITHSNEGIRVSCDGTTRDFANAIYLAEAYAANVLTARQASEILRGEASACLIAIGQTVAKVADLRGTDDGEFLLEKLNDLGKLMTDAGDHLRNF